VLLDKNIPIAVLTFNSLAQRERFSESLRCLDAPLMPVSLDPTPESASRGAQGQVATPCQFTHPASSAIPRDAEKLIKLWLNLPHPFHHQGELFRLAGITSGSKQSTIKRALLSHGLIREHTLQVGKGNISVWEPREKAYGLAGA
jgi:hypothetical protein